MIDIDFSWVQLSKDEKKYLKKLNTKKTRPYTNKIDSLIKCGFADYAEYVINEYHQQIPQKTFVKITEKGLSYLKATRSIALRYWIPIIISNVISVIALIVAIVK